MKFIKTINEYLSSEKITYTKHLTKEILRGVEKYILLSNINDNESFDFCFKNEYIKIIRKILNNYKKNILEKDNLLLMIIEEEYNINETKIICVFKQTKIKRVKPQRFVYHQTDEANLDSILENGLILKDSVNWINDEVSTLEYPSAIFVSNSEKLYYSGDDEGTLTLKIDTSIISNKWWQDLNYPNSKKYIMTFEPIPSYAISIQEQETLA